MRINIGKLLRIVERSNKGWIRAGVLPPCRVYGDGKLIPMVVRVHRKSGRVVVYQANTIGVVKIHKHGKRAVEKTLHFKSIELVRIYK